MAKTTIARDFAIFMQNNYPRRDELRLTAVISNEEGVYISISRKRAALEDVLVPESIATHRARLQNAGFRHVEVWLKHFNFVSLIAIA